MIKGDLYVVSAPSGAGKTTILKAVFEELRGLAYSVSHTTRPPRPGEVHGKDYYFVTREEFQRLIDQEEFLEWAKVHSDYYGTSRKMVEEVLCEGSDVVLDIDVQGAKSLKKKAISGVYVFIAPPSMGVLERRLRARGTETEESLSIRLQNAKKELMAMGEYDYIIVNDRLEEATGAMKAIIMAQRQKRERILPQICPRFGISL